MRTPLCTFRYTCPYKVRTRVCPDFYTRMYRCFHAQHRSLSLHSRPQIFFVLIDSLSGGCPIPRPMLRPFYMSMRISTDACLCVSDSVCALQGAILTVKTWLQRWKLDLLLVGRNMYMEMWEDMSVACVPKRAEACAIRVKMRRMPMQVCMLTCVEAYVQRTELCATLCICANTCASRVCSSSRLFMIPHPQRCV